MRKPQHADKKGVGSVASETVSALDRGLAILHCFSETEQRLGPTELARLTGIPRPSVTRLAATLVAHRLLRIEPDGERFMLGAGVMSLAQVFLGGLDLRAAARAPMQQLAEATGGAVYLALRDGLEMVLVEACRARSSIIAARLDVGSRAPLPNSALGRAYLATVEPTTRNALIESLRLLGNKAWPKQRAGLERALQDHGRDGWCLSVGEFHPEINSVSVAMTSPRGEVMAFNCGGPAFNFTEARLRSEVGPALLAMVQALAEETGGAIQAAPVKPRSVRAEPFDFAQDRPVEASSRRAPR
jgi:IclR family transcriptional regulator, positive regulator for flagellar biogenesis